MLAAFAPAAGTAVALPKIVETAVAAAAPGVLPAPATQESPELLALGAEVEAKLEAYRAAAASLAEARAIATELWPAAPAEILVPHIDDRRFFDDCWERAEDFDGNTIYRDVVGTDGKVYRHAVAVFVLRAERLQAMLDDVGAEPERWEDVVPAKLLNRIEAAKRYEAACAHSIEASGIEEAKRAAQGYASDLHSLLFEVRKHAPRSIAGVLIVARAVMAFEEAQKESDCGGERAGGLILGRELADAVLRVGAPA